MSFIVAVAYAEVLVLEPPRETWQELQLDTPVPAHVASAVLPQVQRYRRFVEPIFAPSGDVTGLRVSSRMSRPLAQRLRKLIEPFLRPPGERPPPATAESPRAPRTLSLSRFGLCIPQRNAMRARSMLEQLADIELQYDPDEEDVVALLIPPGVSPAAIFSVLKVDAVPIEPSSENHRQHLLDLLLDELKRLHERRPGS